MSERLPLGLVLAVLFLLVWVAVGTVGFMAIEAWSWIDSLYMTIITLSTVGFGEVEPLSPPGRLFASVIIAGGLGTAVYTFTRLGQLVVEGELLDLLGRRRMKRDLEKLTGHYVVCGFGRIGAPVAEGLERDGLPFCVVDRDRNLEEELRQRGYVYLIGDATDEDVLRGVGIEGADSLMALLPSDADNLYLAMTAKSLNAAIRVIARALDEKAEVKLKRGGADRVVSPYPMAAARVLQAAVRPTVVDFMELVTHREHLALSLEEVTVDGASSLAGRSLAQAEIRRRCGVIVVAIKKASGEMAFNPDPGEVIVAGDLLVAMGTREDLNNLEELCH